MMRRVLAAITLALAAAAAVSAQTGADEARKEMNLGARAYREGRFAEAEQRFRRALELDPEGKNTRLYLARAVQQQYKPGDQTPENLAVGERAVAAYQELLAKDPRHEEAHKAVLSLYAQMQSEEKAREFLLSRANDFSLPNDLRADAFTTLAGKHWQCSHEVTEQKENKATEEKENKVVVRHKMPADQGDFIRARQCATEGLQLAEQAVGLAPKNRTAWSYKVNLLREGAKLAEMEGDAAQKAEYERQYLEAVEMNKGLTQEAPGERPLDGHPVTPGGAAAGEQPAKAPRVISGGVLNSRAVSKPEPAYPAIAKAAGAEGTVTVQVLVDEEGNVVSASAVSGHPLLQQAAVAAARQARFRPTLLSGRPARVSGVITYNFVNR